MKRLQHLNLDEFSYYESTFKSFYSNTIIHKQYELERDGFSFGICCDALGKNWFGSVKKQGKSLGETPITKTPQQQIEFLNSCIDLGIVA